MDNYHIPVLKDAVVGGLNIERGGLYIDATIGGGGHTEEILKRGGKVLGIDQDQDAIEHLKKKFESEILNGQLILAHGNFAEIRSITTNSKFLDNQSYQVGVNGILMDLGVSSHHIDNSGRGFSFNKNEPLDMRMDVTRELTAEKIINTWTEDELYEIFAKYGEEVNSRNVARQIVNIRKNKKINTSSELSEIITKVIKRDGKLHQSTRIFQALRIAVNDELENLKKGLVDGFKLLLKGGRMEVISFHSLEDRIVKVYFASMSSGSQAKIITKKPIIAEFAEVRKNRRARSAKLRIIEK